MHIYLLTFPNGKRYIGQTVKTVEHRVNHHRNCVNAGSMLAAHCAWRIHGKPLVETVASYSDLVSLNAAEVAAIIKYGTLAPSGYNVALGGADGSVKSDVVKAKMAASSTGKKATPETRAKLSAIMRARWAAPEYRAAHGTKIQRPAFVRGEDWKERQRVAQTGKKRGPMTDEAKAKLAASIKATHNGKARGPAISAALKSRHERLTPEQRQEFSDARKRSWETRRAQKKETIA